MKYKVCIVVVIAGSFLVINSCKSEYPSDSMTTVELHSRVYPEGEKATAALLFGMNIHSKIHGLKVKMLL